MVIPFADTDLIATLHVAMHRETLVDVGAVKLCIGYLSNFEPSHVRHVKFDTNEVLCHRLGSNYSLV